MHRQNPPTRPSLNRPSLTLGVWLAGLLALLGAALAPGAAFAAAPAPTPTPQATEALSWLAGQLAANPDRPGTMPPSFGTGTDWGLTMDAVLAYVAAGDADNPAAVTATDIIAEPASVAFYTSDGTEAGAVAKTLLTLLSMDRPTVVGAIDLEATLRSMMETSGDQAGRFSDIVADPAFNASNGFGQSLAIIALSMTPAGVPADAVDFLVDQQCPGGGFRLMYITTPGCTLEANGDTDTTALSLQALLAVDRTPAVLASLESGLAWLLSRQESDGSWGTPPWGGPNSNSTGLISQLLRAAGYTDQATRGERWIESLQLTPLNAGSTPAAPNEGGIAYNRSGFDSALTDGVTPQMSDQWRRATSQAVLGLGLAPYGVQDVDPLVTTTTAPTSSTTSSTSSSTVPVPTTAVPTTATPTTSGPPTTTPATAPVTNGSGGASVQGLTGDQVASTSSAGSAGSPSGTGTLARTGGDSRRLIVVAVLLMASGAILTGSQLRRRPVGVGDRAGR